VTNTSTKTNYITVLSPAGAPVAAFSGSPTDTIIGNPVSFADASTNSPTSWAWSFGDSSSSTLQNPTHAYSSLGLYTVNLTVANLNGTSTLSRASYVNITNTTPTGVTDADITMSPSFVLTLHVTDSSTGNAIPDVTLSDSNGNTYNTTTGTFTLSYGYGAVVLSLTSTGYISKSVSYVIDSDQTQTAQLVEQSTLNNYAVTYPPKDVRFHVQTLAGANLQSVSVTAAPFLTTLGNYDYVSSLFGYNLEKVPLSNQTLAGTTDSRGDITFAMMADVQYQISATKSGYTFTNFTVTPHDDNYLIYPDSTGSLFVTNGTAPAASVKYIMRSTRINQTVAVINISYVDMAGATTGGNINLHRNARNNT
jgi:PKD repeat protein